MDSEPSLLFLFISLLSLLILSAFFSGSETGMMAANKIYRKEDIQAMSSRAVNPGWGPNGANTYDIWLYKGGGSCHHKWLRQTFKIKGTKGSIYGPKSEQISTAEARRQGFNPVNEKEVSMKPKDMPKKGFLK